VNDHFHVPVTIKEDGHSKDGYRAITTAALINSGATTSFISKQIVQDMNLTTHKFDEPIPLLNIDGTTNTAGRITHYVHLELYLPTIGGHKSRTMFAVTEIDDQDLIIGIDWLIQHNPHINWKEGTITFKCCGFQKNHITIKRTLPPEEVRRHSWYSNQRKYSEQDYSMRILAGMSKSQELAIAALQNQSKEPIPKEYQDYRDIFSKEKSNRLPEHKSWDLEIIVQEGKELPKPRKAFPMSPGEVKALKEFLNQELALGRIRQSKSETVAPVFFIKKKDGSLRFVQDYRGLNEVTVRNRYPIPLTSELIDQLREAKYFTHLDLRNGYNNVRIKEGHEYKLAFNTPIGLFEPLVMYFGMTNAPGAFQSLMNEIFRDMIINMLIVIYLDDILIFSKSLTEQHKNT